MIDWEPLIGLILTMTMLVLRAWKSRRLVALQTEIDELEEEIEDLNSDMHLMDKEQRRLHRRLQALREDSDDGETGEPAIEREGAESEES